MLLIDKRARSPVGLYAASLTSGDDVTATRIAQLPVPLATAMDISPDGKRLFIGTYGPTVVFGRDAKGNWDARTQAVIPMPPRRQGEAMAVDHDGWSILTTSERTPTPLWLLRPVQPELADPTPRKGPPGR